MSGQTVVATAAYRRAKEFVQAHFNHEIIWQSTVRISEITESDFLREAAWVIFCSGFRERTLRIYFSYLSLSFCDWESAAVIAEHAEACRTAALAGFNNGRKVNAVIEIARRVVRDGFPTLKNNILNQPIEVLQTLPHIGPVTVYHLAKNLGLPVAKPDRHLQRLAAALSYADAHLLCKDISDITGDPPHVVDLIFWRYMAEKQDARQGYLWSDLALGVEAHAEISLSDDPSCSANCLASIVAI
jgi:hypothetical protein